ncbi:MAG: hypothetical protein LBR39_08185 [Coriobacteriales bacterium]|nr:hypothetical protein [Coriobacteriales bacterium]
MPTPDIQIVTPDISVPLPDVQATAPELDVTVAQVSSMVPDVDLGAANIDLRVPTPEADVAAVQAAVPQIDIDINAPTLIPTAQSSLNFEADVTPSVPVVTAEAPTINIDTAAAVQEAQAYMPPRPQAGVTYSPPAISVDAATGETTGIGVNADNTVANLIPDIDPQSIHAASNITSADLDVAVPRIDLNIPEPAAASAAIDANGLVVNLGAPKLDVDTPAPRFETLTPEVNIPVTANAPVPAIGVVAPEVNIPTAVAGIPTPEVSYDLSKVEHTYDLPFSDLTEEIPIVEPYSADLSGISPGAAIHAVSEQELFADNAFVDAGALYSTPASNLTPPDPTVVPGSPARAAIPEPAPQVVSAADLLKDYHSTVGSATVQASAPEQPVVQPAVQTVPEPAGEPVAAVAAPAAVPVAVPAAAPTAAPTAAPAAAPVEENVYIPSIPKASSSFTPPSYQVSVEPAAAPMSQPLTIEPDKPDATI